MATKTTDEGLCQICLQSLALAGRGRQTLECGHMMHEDCVRHRRQSNSSCHCPTCGKRCADLSSVKSLVRESALSFAQGNLDMSYARAAEAFELDNESASACSQLLHVFAEGYENASEARKAVEHLEKASQSCPWFGHDVGNYYSKIGNPKKAIAFYELGSRSQSPFQPLTSINLGILYWKEGRVEEAEACFHQALKAGLVGAACVNLGMICLERGDVKEAEQHWERAWRQHRVSEAAVNLGRLRRSNGDLVSAMALFKEALACKDSGAALDLGDMYDAQGDLDRAAAAYQIAMKFMLNGAHYADDDIRRHATSKYIQVKEKQAYEFTNASQIDDAMKSYEAARDAGSVRAAFQLGKLKDQQGKTRAALDLYKEAWSKGYNAAGNHLGVTSEELGMLEEAYQVYRDGHERGDAQSSYNLGCVYLDKFKSSDDPADFESARRCFEVTHSKGHADGITKLGWIKQMEGDQIAAHSLYEEAHKKGSSVATAALAERASKVGDTHKADQLFAELHASPDACPKWASREVFVGGEVNVVRLTSTEGRKLNGRCGRVVQALDVSTGRIGVKLEGDDRTKAIKAKNLILKSSSIPARPLWEETVTVLNDIPSLNAQLSASVLDNMERIMLLKYNRHDKRFEAALSDNLDLADCKAVLQQANLPWKLETGTMVFVRPWQYAGSVSALREMCPELRPWHVLVSESLEPAIRAALDSLPSRAGARVKQRSLVTTVQDSMARKNHAKAGRWWSFCSRRLSQQESATVFIHASDDSEAPQFPLCVKRTFICRQSVLRDPRSVVNSSTEAHGGINPRRVPISSQGSFGGSSS